jgi:hypothetical protein
MISLTPFSSGDWGKVYELLRLTDFMFTCLMNLTGSSKGGFSHWLGENTMKSSFPSFPLFLQEKSSLTNAEFEEIVQIVLQKSLQECLGMICSKRKMVSVR